MNVHIFSTDVSCFQLMDALPEGYEVTHLVVPSNRKESDKLEILVAEAKRRGITIHRHELRSLLGNELPEAHAGISWLYSQIIDIEDLRRYSKGILNMHGGIIPDYRGASVLHWAIINGESELGVTWHEMAEQVDSGAIWAESRIPIHETDTALKLRRRLIIEGVRLFPMAWERFFNPVAVPRIPDLSGGRVWPQRKPQDGQICPGMSAKQVRDMVRALCPPWPAAFVKTEDGPFFVRVVMDEEIPGCLPFSTSDGKTVYLHHD